ncbi:MAG: hypothetical protein WA269_15700 [Candidatus Udaeobacter sp.]|jgi:hypothetical protein
MRARIRRGLLRRVDVSVRPYADRDEIVPELGVKTKLAVILIPQSREKNPATSKLSPIP